MFIHILKYFDYCSTFQAFSYQNCPLFLSFCTISQYPMVQQKQKMTIISVLHIITQCHSSEECKRQAHSNNINNKSPIFKQLSYTVTRMMTIYNTHGHTHTNSQLEIQIQFHRRDRSSSHLNLKFLAHTQLELPPNIQNTLYFMLLCWLSETF